MPALMIYRLKKKTENLNRHFMKNELAHKKDNLAEEPIVIPDECGDTLWDAVLQQQVNACEVENVPKNAVALLNCVNTVQVSR